MTWSGNAPASRNGWLRPTLLRAARYETGHLYGRDYRQTYTAVYTQPWHSYLVAFLYHHVWERLTHRLLYWLERRFQRRRGVGVVPWAVRQSVRCAYLHRRWRRTVDRMYGPQILWRVDG